MKENQKESGLNRKEWLEELVSEGIRLEYFPVGAKLSKDMEWILTIDNKKIQDTECWEMYRDGGDSPTDAILEDLSYA